MEPREGAFASPVDGLNLVTHHWGDHLESPHGVVQIAHGLSEHGRRYDEVAREFVTAGFRVVAADQRGHGRSTLPGHPPGDLGEGGFREMIDDIAALGEHVGDANPGLPLFLLGQSMGSYAAQHVILDHPQRYAGVVLAGSAAVDVLAATMMAGGAIPAQPSGFNAPFGADTGFEWLSRDPLMVHDFVTDPLVSVEVPEGMLIQLVYRSDRLADPAELAALPADLPILLLSGRADPLSGDGQLVALLAQRYRIAGLSDVTMQIYPGARHQLFLEVNRAQVIGDVVRWCAAHV